MTDPSTTTSTCPCIIHPLTHIAGNNVIFGKKYKSQRVVFG